MVKLVDTVPWAFLVYLAFGAIYFAGAKLVYRSAKKPSWWDETPTESEIIQEKTIENHLPGDSIKRRALLIEIENELNTLQRNPFPRARKNFDFYAEFDQYDDFIYPAASNILRFFISIPERCRAGCHAQGLQTFR